MEKIFECKIIIFIIFALGITAVNSKEKQPITAIYIPLADHYPGIVAYEKYKNKMEKADYKIMRMMSWSLLRVYFMSGEVDMAYIICPMAMDMFTEKPNFRWVSLMHRDGNALAINDLLNKDVKLPKERVNSKPDHKVAEAYTNAKKKIGRPSECGCSAYSCNPYCSTLQVSERSRQRIKLRKRDGQGYSRH